MSPIHVIFLTGLVSSVREGGATEITGETESRNR